jgi:hypothetical protein
VVFLVEESTRRKIKIATTVSGINIEVWLDGLNDFRDGYATLKQLASWVPVEEARYFIQKIWLSSDQEPRLLPDFITESSHRIAISLLDSWPKVKQISEVSSETGLSGTGVQYILSGRRGSSSNWFYKTDEGWSLTNYGIQMMLKEVIPYIQEAMGNKYLQESLY